MFVCLFYLLISVIVAVLNIYTMQREENALMEVEIGDLYLYEQRTKIVTFLTVIFFPSILIQLAWVGVCGTVNNLM